MLLPCVARKLHQIRRGLDSSQYRCQRLEPVGSAVQVSPERVTIMWSLQHSTIYYSTGIFTYTAIVSCFVEANEQ